jgi:hypothetical protein
VRWLRTTAMRLIEWKVIYFSSSFPFEVVSNIYLVCIFLL